MICLLDGGKLLLMHVVCFQVGSPQIPKDPEKVPATGPALLSAESPPPQPTLDQAISGISLCYSIGFVVSSCTNLLHFVLLYFTSHLVSQI